MMKSSMGSDTATSNNMTTITPQQSPPTTNQLQPHNRSKTTTTSLVPNPFSIGKGYGSTTTTITAPTTVNNNNNNNTHNGGIGFPQSMSFGPSILGFPPSTSTTMLHNNSLIEMTSEETATTTANVSDDENECGQINIQLPSHPTHPLSSHAPHPLSSHNASHGGPFTRSKFSAATPHVSKVVSQSVGAGVIGGGRFGAGGGAAAGNRMTRFGHSSSLLNSTARSSSSLLNKGRGGTRQGGTRQGERYSSGLDSPMGEFSD